MTHSSAARLTGIILLATMTLPIYGTVVDDLIATSNTLGQKLITSASAQAPTQNLVVAAPSIMVTLGIIGAGTAGKTRTEWQSTLGLSHQKAPDIGRGFSLLHSLLTDPSFDITLTTFDSIWVGAESRPLDSFIKYTNEFFDTDVQRTNFRSPDTLPMIQKWVTAKTNRMIRDFPPSIDPATSLLVLNTLYFKGDWQFPFDAKRSDERLFISPTLPPKKTPVMIQNGQFQFAETRDTQAVILPYGEGRFEWVIIAPRRWDPNHLPWEWLTPSHSESFEDTPVTLVIPKFKFSSRNALRSALSDAGFQGLFSPKADFSAIGPNIRLTDLLQQVVITVDESGTRAAAATAGLVGTTSVERSTTPASLILNRPFLYALRDTISGLCLFVGTYVYPEEGSNVPQN